MMPRIRFLLACLLTIGLLACSKPAEEQSQTPSPPESPAAPEQTPAPAATAPDPPPTSPAEPARPAARPAPAGTAPSTPRPAPVQSASVPEPVKTEVPKPSTVAPAPVTAIVASGTPLEIRLTGSLSSATGQSGDRFEATLSQALEQEGKILAPRGSVVVGRLSNVEGSGRVEGKARMSLSLTELQVGQETYPLRSNVLSFEAESTRGRDAKAVGGSAGVGAIIGAIAGGKKGAAIGAAIGAGAGTATVLVTKGKEVEFEPEQKFSFKLERDLELKIR